MVRGKRVEKGSFGRIEGVFVKERGRLVFLKNVTLMRMWLWRFPLEPILFGTRLSRTNLVCK